MKKDDFLKILLVIIWIVCPIIVYFGLKYREGIISLIAITSTYYLTKFYITGKAD